MQARFAGRCSDCDHTISVGEMIVSSGEGWSHESCQDALATPEQIAATCTECWLIQPCGCS